MLADELGMVPGNRVLLRGPNNPWLAACWLGVLKAGGVAVTTMALLRAAELSSICGIAQVRLALCDHRFTGELAAADVDGLRVISYGGPGEDDLAQRVTPMPRNFGAVDTAADDVAMIAFTSGTTGRPKAAMHFHRDLLAIADTFSARVLKPRADDIFTGTPPLAFTYGLGGLLVFPLRAGASTLLLERATPAELADQIAARGVTVLSTAPDRVPGHARRGQGRAAARAAPAGLGGRAPVRLDLAGVLRRHRGEDHRRHRQHRDAAHLHLLGRRRDPARGRPAGPCPATRPRSWTTRASRCRTGTPGRLAVKGPTGCRYLADDRQRSYVQDGWNLTGDTYIRDADGYFWYQARSDDMIISGGYNIAGPEVEEVLLGHPDVAECGVVGVPDEARGQIVKAFVVLRDGADGGDGRRPASCRTT